MSRTTNSKTSRRELVSLAEAAGFADVSVRTMQRWIEKGRVRAYRVGPRLVKVDLLELEQLAFKPYGGAA